MWWGTVIKFSERLMHLGFKYTTLSGISLTYQESIPSSNKSKILVKMTEGCDDFIKGRNISINRTHDYEGCWSGYKTTLKQIHLDVDANIRGSGLTRHRFKWWLTPVPEVRCLRSTN